MNYPRASVPILVASIQAVLPHIAPDEYAARRDAVRVIRSMIPEQRPRTIRPLAGRQGERPARRARHPAPAPRLRPTPAHRIERGLLPHAAPGPGHPAPPVVRRNRSNPHWDTRQAVGAGTSSSRALAPSSIDRGRAVPAPLHHCPNLVCFDLVPTVNVANDPLPGSYDSP